MDNSGSVRNVKWIRTAGHPESSYWAAGTFHGQFLKNPCEGWLHLIFSLTKYKMSKGANWICSWQKVRNRCHMGESSIMQVSCVIFRIEVTKIRHILAVLNRINYLGTYTKFCWNLGAINDIWCVHAVAQGWKRLLGYFWHSSGHLILSKQDTPIWIAAMRRRSMREVKENKNLIYRIWFKRSWCGTPGKRTAEQETKLLLA